MCSSTGSRFATARVRWSAMAQPRCTTLPPSRNSLRIANSSSTQNWSFSMAPGFCRRILSNSGAGLFSNPGHNADCSLSLSVVLRWVIRRNPEGAIRQRASQFIYWGEHWFSVGIGEHWRWHFSVTYPAFSPVGQGPKDFFPGKRFYFSQFRERINGAVVQVDTHGLGVHTSLVGSRIAGGPNRFTMGCSKI